MIRIKFHLVIATLFVSMTIAARADEGVPREMDNGADYGVARAAMLSKGWRPAPDAGERNAWCAVSSNKSLCDALPEASTCKAGGKAECSIVWVIGKPGRESKLVVTTTGTNPRKVEDMVLE
jgi:hypothetical protein